MTVDEFLSRVRMSEGKPSGVFWGFVNPRGVSATKNVQGNLIERYFYGPTGEVIRRISRRCDSLGDLIEEVHWDGKGEKLRLVQCSFEGSRRKLCFIIRESLFRGGKPNISNVTIYSCRKSSDQIKKRVYRIFPTIVSKINN